MVGEYSVLGTAGANAAGVNTVSDGATATYAVNRESRW
jgi:hypothetical protein